MRLMSRAAQFDSVISQAFLQALHYRGAAVTTQLTTVSSTRGTSGPQADVVVFPVTAAERRPWVSLKQALIEAAARMNAHGVLYVIAPGSSRWRIARFLRKRGLSNATPVLHLGSGDARFYVPLTHRSLGFALRTWPLSRRWRYVERLLKYVPGSSILLRRTLPNLGFASYDAGGEPFGWLLSRVTQSKNSEAIVATSWRGVRGATVLFAFADDDSTPSLVAKLVARSSKAALRHEAGILQSLSQEVKRAGARVPEVIEFSDDRDGGSLFMSGLPGQPASILLRERPSALPNVVGQLSGWLARWHAATLSQFEFTTARCEQLILAPARLLAPELDRADAYVEWLTKACGRLIGRAVPFVCAHNDLTMSNVLIDEKAPLGIVDWEEARVDGLPLADFWYSACDAVLAASSRDRISAFSECFPSSATRSGLIQSYERELASIIGPAPPEWIELCFHACWIHHAVNERARKTSEDRSFLAIVNRLSQFHLA